MIRHFDEIEKGALDRMRESTVDLIGLGIKMVILKIQIQQLLQCFCFEPKHRPTWQIENMAWRYLLATKQHQLLDVVEVSTPLDQWLDGCKMIGRHSAHIRTVQAIEDSGDEFRRAEIHVK
ncbi:hypothetical protein VQ03_02430 [Methylobacterium tarhaniae]|uniref:Uncharacterized protein n=1 Tax=Methylobacterium tarhaniae TaxID=1187852 RepID=A0A0J6VZ27_9HYPH|nr:hypothetical protein VQ03_02430 [Methylobacterium tarhaniae]